jgi:YidC/Oxa1 family membrane protein insertase
MFKEIFDKNTLLGIALIGLMVALYFKFENKLAPAPIITADTSSVKQTPQSALVASTSIDSSKTNKDTSKVSATIVPNQLYSIENSLVKIEFNSKGGAIADAILKKYTTSENKPVVLFDKSNNQWNYSFPSNTGVLESKNADFSVVETTSNSIKLKATNGLEVTYVLDSNSYYVNQYWSVPNYQKNGLAKVQFETELIPAEADIKRERMYSTINFLKDHDDVVEKLNMTKNDDKEVKEPTKWISLTQQFFNASIVPAKSFTKSSIKSFYLEDEKNYVKKYSATLENNDLDSLKYQYFLGPNSYSILKHDKNKLVKIIPLSPDFVLMRWVKIFNEYFIIPLFDFFSQFLSNYGLIIFLVTLIVKLILTPLSFKTFKSGVAMKILKPELEALRKKTGDDQQKYALEQSKIFNEAGVNPLGGCLPMLLQMPILFALYSFFPSSLELRHEHFLWAQDLSTFDNILTLPFTIPVYGNHVSLFTLLMTLTQIGTTLYSQRLQPSSPQADQMKMMTYIMPIMFLFMFNSLPAAMTYYYLLQNVLSILQQWSVTKFFISEDKVRAEIEEHRKKPKKQGGFQQKMQEMMQQAEEAKKLQQNKK